jgi:microcystin-dependent protein
VTLSITQIPTHTHVASATSIVTDPGHNHAIGKSNSTGGSGTIAVGNLSPKDILSDTKTTGITVSTNVVNANAGGGLPHPNFQPGLGCYYIMYIP